MKVIMPKRFTFILAFALPLIAYLLTMPKGLTWANFGADGGDLITAAVTLGVPHPSGYPTYTLLGWLFTRLPVETLSWRVGLLSAVAMAGAAFFVCRIIVKKTKLPIAGLVGAWSFATVPLVWGQAVIAEVYGVNLFFIGLLLWLATQFDSGGQNVVMSFPRKREPIDSGYFPAEKSGMTAFWLGLVFGLALGTHLTVIFMLPYIVYCVFRAKNATRNTQYAILGFLLGAAIFLYLPIRAGQGAITWGAPDTIDGFWALVSGQIYHSYLFNVSGEVWATRISILSDYFRQAGLPILFLAGVGVYQFWLKKRAMLLLAMLSVAGYAIYALSYGTPDSFIYVLPVFLLMGLAVGVGTADILSQVESPRGRLWSGVLLLAATLFISGARFNAMNLRTDAEAENFWMAAMSQMPPDAIVFSDKDNYTFALWYARYAIKYRTDVTIVDTRLTTFDWYRANLARENPALALESLSFENRENLARPVCKIMEDETLTHWASICLP